MEQVKDALARYRLRKNDPQSIVESDSDGPTVAYVCQIYLEHCRATDAESTYENRAGTLLDFVTGYSCLVADYVV